MKMGKLYKMKTFFKSVVKHLQVYHWVELGKSQRKASVMNKCHNGKSEQVLSWDSEKCFREVKTFEKDLEGWINFYQEEIDRYLNLTEEITSKFMAGRKHWTYLKDSYECVRLI